MPKIPDPYRSEGRLTVARQQPLQARILQSSGGISVSGGELNARVGSYHPIQLETPIDRTDAKQIGNSIAAFGETLFNTSLRMAEMDAVTEAKQARINLRTKINEVMYDREGALNTKSGKAFIDAVPAAKAEVEDFFKQQMESLGDRAKSHFTLEGLESINDMKANVAQTSAAHRRKWVDDTAKAYDQQMMAEIGNNYMDLDKAVALMNKHLDKIAIDYPGPEGRLRQADAQNEGISALVSQAVTDKNFVLAGKYVDYARQLSKIAAEDPESGVGVSLETVAKLESFVDSHIEAAESKREVAENKYKQDMREKRAEANMAWARDYYNAPPAERAVLRGEIAELMTIAGSNEASEGVVAQDLFDQLRLADSIDNNSGKDGSKALVAQVEANLDLYEARPDMILNMSGMAEEDKVSLISKLNVSSNASTKELNGFALRDIKTHITGDPSPWEISPGTAAEKKLVSDVHRVYAERMDAGLKRLKDPNVPEDQKNFTVKQLHTKVLSSLKTQYAKLAKQPDQLAKMPDLYRGMYFNPTMDITTQKVSFEDVVAMDYKNGVIGEEEAQIQLDLIEQAFVLFSSKPKAKGPSSGVEE